MKKAINHSKRIATLLIVSIVSTIVSAFMLFVREDVIPFLFYFAASFTGMLMFSAIYLARWKNPIATILLVITLLYLLVLSNLQLLQENAKTIYPLLVFIFLGVIVSSLQHYQEVKLKPAAKWMKFLNYGLLMLIAPFLFLKIELVTYWNLLSLSTAIIMILNAVLALSPSKKSI